MRAPSDKRQRRRADQLALPFDAAGEDIAESGVAQATMQFLLGLRGRGIRNVEVLRALETVPRELFVPHRLVDLAWRDIGLPIACGQSMPDPFLVARMCEALGVAARHRVLEIGSGSGYVTAILARMAQEVVSFERFQTLAVEAGERLARLKLANAHIIWGDGLAPPENIGLFDRILVHGLLDPLPKSLVALLSEGGIIVCAGQGDQMAENGRPERRLQRHSHNGGPSLVMSDLGVCTLPLLIEGRSGTL